MSTSYVYALPKVLNDAPAVARYVVNGWCQPGSSSSGRRPADHYVGLSNNLEVSGPESRSRGVFRQRGLWRRTCAGATNCRNFLNRQPFLNPRRHSGTSKRALSGPGLYRLGCQHRTQLSIQRAGRPDLPRRVLQPAEPHQSGRSRNHCGGSLGRSPAPLLRTGPPRP